jgi:hypothetical protein
MGGDNWRPIETAPRGGTRVLVFDLIHGQRAAALMTSLEDRDEQWVYARSLSNSAVAFICHPTHWQPLPAPPSDAAP